MTDEATPTPEEQPGPSEPSRDTANTSPVPERVGKPAGRYTLRFAVIYAALGVILVGAVAGLVVLVVGSSAEHLGQGLVDLEARQRNDREDGEGDRRPRRRRVPPEQEGRPARRGRLRPASGDERHAQGDDLEHRSPEDRRRPQGHPDRPLGKHVDGSALRPRLATARSRRARPPRRAAGSSAERRSRWRSTRSSSCRRSTRSWRSCRLRPARPQTTLLYLQKDNLKKQLAEPLREDAAAREAAAADRTGHRRRPSTIDKLTLPAVYKYSLAAASGRERAARPEPVPDVEPAQL